VSVLKFKRNANNWRYS